jgi:hypothetical protein
VIPLGLRLVVSGGREAIIRLVILTIAVGLGVGLLLTAVAATNATVAWNNRHAWYWTGTSSVPAGPAAGVAPLWWHPVGDLFGGYSIERFDVAATGASAPVPPGIPRDPAPGQYYASPALVALMRAAPANELADRYPGHLAGTIGEMALPSPASLVIVISRIQRTACRSRPLPTRSPASRTSALAQAAGRRRTPGDWPTRRATRVAGRTPSISSCPSWRWPSCSRC